MINQNAKVKHKTEKTNNKWMESESPNRIDIKDGGTTGERRL